MSVTYGLYQKATTKEFWLPELENTINANTTQIFLIMAYSACTWCRFYM